MDIEEKLSEKRKTLLIVDDEYVNRVILLRALSQYYNVLSAENGQAALDVLRSQQIDAVLSDIMMPVMDGYELLSVMKGDPDLVNIPVIIITGSGDEHTEIKALDLGARDLITKPYNIDVILRRVGNILAQLDAINAVRNNMSNYDVLTGLLSRSAFVVEARERILSKKSSYYILCCLDIDNFKVINDRYGHDEGDTLLKFISNECFELSTKLGGIACRDTADIFLALLPNDGMLSDYASELADNIRKYPLPIAINVHIGKYDVDDLNIDVNLMIDRAILAVKTVKGSSEVAIGIFNAEMRDKILRQQELIDEMRPALESGQFVLFFQPQYNYSLNKITGAEALVRWKHPVKGMIPPNEFIPLFENNGFITHLDLYVWEQACKYLREWRDKGLPHFPVSVNISRIDIRNADITKVIPELVKKYGLTPDCLHLEITESAYFDQPNELIETVLKLQSLGFVVEMDDFGSGYSSLNILKDVPVDVLKLDMKFVRECNNDERGGNILSSVVRMAHWLKTPVIAEGIETVEQADYLKSIGCYVMQGYLFSKPLPPDEHFESFISSYEFAPVIVEAKTTGALGKIDFLDASAQATLLFNSFIGGAIIAEFDGTNLEFLRSNDRFYEILNFTREEYDRRGLNLFEHIDKPSKAKLLSALIKAIETGKETQCELRTLPSFSNKKELWTLCRFRFLTQNIRKFMFYIAVENISESKELENTRRDLKNIVENVPAGIVIYHQGEKTIPTFISKNAYELFGFSEEEEPEDVVKDGFILPEAFLSDEEQKKIFLSGMPIDVTVSAQRKDDSWFWLRAVLRLVKRRGKNSLIYATMFDASNQNEIDTELNAFIQAIPGGLFKFATDKEGAISYVSDNFLQMLGYTNREFSEKFRNRFWKMVYWEDLERVRAKISESVSLHKPQTVCDYRIECKDHSLKWFFSAIHMVKDSGGKDWFYSVDIDISQRKLLEKKLDDEIKHSNALIANSPGGGITLTLNTDNNLFCPFISEGFATMLGYTHRELKKILDSDLFATVYEGDKEMLKRKCVETMQSLSNLKVDFRLVLKDSSLIWVDMTANSVKTNDNTVNFYCVFTDITEHVRNEESIRIENERNKLILNNTDLAIWDYDYRTDTLYLDGLRKEISTIERRLFTNFIERFRKDEDLTLQSRADILNMLENASKAPISGTLDYQSHIWGKGLRWGRLHYASVCDESGAVYRLVGVIVDIQAEKERQQLLEQLQLKSNPIVYNTRNLGDIFTYLYDAKDFDEAISHTIGVLGKFYKASRVYVIERDKDDSDLFSNSFEWCEDESFSLQKERQKLTIDKLFAPDYLNFFDKNGFLSINDVLTLDSKYRKVFEKTNTKATMQWSILFGGKVLGIIGFDDCKNSREWLPEQIGTLSFIRGLISLYIARKREQAQNVLSEDFISALNKSAFCVYIVNPKNHEIVYQNKAFVERFGKTKAGITCYRLMKQKKVCEQCPIFIAEKQGASIPIEFQSYDGNWLLAQASKVNWEGSEMYMITCADINEQKKAEEAQKNAAEENAIVIKQSGKKVLRYDIKNDTAYDLINAFEFVGLPCGVVPNYESVLVEKGVVLPDSLTEMRACFNELREGKPECSCDLQLKLTNGEHRWHHVDCAVVFKEGQPDYAIISLYDTTNKREIDNLRLMLQTVIDTVPGGILIYCFDKKTKDVTLQYFNDEMCRIGGCTREEYAEITREKPWVLIDKNESQFIKSIYDAIVHEGKDRVEGEYKINTKFGLKWVSLIGNVVRDSEHIYLYLILTDISRRKKAEEQLSYRNDYLEKIDYALSAGTIVTSLNANRSLLHVSKNIENFSGYTANEFTALYRSPGKPYIHHSDLERVQRLSARYSTERPPCYEMEYRFIKKDGSIFWIMEKAAFLPDFQGEPAYLSVFVDISRQMKTLKENEQLLKIVAKHSQKYLAIYDFETDTFKPLDSSVNKMRNILPLFACPQDYIDKGYVANESLEEITSCYISLKAGKANNSARFKALSLNNTWRWLKCTFTTVFDDFGKPLYAIASFEDITNIYEKELAFMRYQKIIEATNPNTMSYLDYDLTSNTLEGFSDRSNKQKKYIPIAKKGFTECIKYMSETFIYEEDKEKFLSFFNRTALIARFAEGTLSNELEVRIQPDKKSIPIYIRISYQMVSDPYTYDIRIMIINQIIDKEKRAEQELLNKARFDTVTGVYNRATFLEKLYEKINNGTNNLCAFAMLDVDHFKTVNDTFGHIEGDNALKTIAHSISEQLSELDVLGRLGGDEFGIFFGNMKDKEAVEEKVKSLVHVIYRDLGSMVVISASIGVALFPKDATTFEGLYEKSDIALYNAKEEGRNRYIFYTDDMSTMAHIHMVTPIDSSKPTDTD